MSVVLSLLLSFQSAPADAVDWDKEFGVEEKVRDPATGEFPVAAYTASNSNAEASQFDGLSMAQSFGGQKGIKRISDRTVEIAKHDPRISEIFAAHDLVRLKRTLFEQFCFILNAGCNYSGRDMREAHKNLGVQPADLNALVEILQQAMREERVPFALQNRFLAKLAPLSAHVIQR